MNKNDLISTENYIMQVQHCSLYARFCTTFCVHRGNCHICGSYLMYLSIPLSQYNVILKLQSNLSYRARKETKHVACYSEKYFFFGGIKQRRFSIEYHFISILCIRKMCHCSTEKKVSFPLLKGHTATSIILPCGI